MAYKEGYDMPRVRGMWFTTWVDKNTELKAFVQNRVPFEDKWEIKVRPDGKDGVDISVITSERDSRKISNIEWLHHNYFVIC